MSHTNDIFNADSAPEAGGQVDKLLPWDVPVRAGNLDVDANAWIRSCLADHVNAQGRT